MVMLLVAAGPTGLVMRVHPMVAVPLYCLNLDYPMLQVVEEQDFVCPNRQLAVVQDFACPRQVVEEQDFVYPNRQLVAAPSLEFVVEEPGSVRPNRQPVARDFAYPSPLVAAE